MELQVCGAAREVTGSCYLLDVGATRFLVDCGMHQGGDKEFLLNFAPFAFDPHDVAFLVLTHAHIDHAGLIPRLIAEGFSGPVYATPATSDLATIMLLDSAHIQEMEAEWRRRKRERAGRVGPKPLYTQEDARRASAHFKTVDYGSPFEAAPGVTLVFHDAGHILGSAFLELRLSDAPDSVKLMFSGDVGQPDQPIIRDPEIVSKTDYLVLESTYGDRLHNHSGDPVEQLAAILRAAKASGGNVIIPAFAVERTQELLYFFRQLWDRGELDMPVYVDSPLAREATEVFRQHEADFDQEAAQMNGKPGGIFDFPLLHFTETADDSRALNGKRGIVIISASGMADAGRIKHHLKHNLWRPEAHVIIVGFMAEGTLGRRLLEGEKRVRIFGEEIAVKAQIHEMTELSAHADQGQLLEWASHFKPPYLTILTHGEMNAATTLARMLESKLGFKTVVAERNEVFDLKEVPA